VVLLAELVFREEHKRVEVGCVWAKKLTAPEQNDTQQLSKQARDEPYVSVGGQHRKSIGKNSIFGFND